LNLYILIISIILFQGCATKVIEPLPSFVLKHPQGTANIIYGVGVGSSYMEAKAKALNDISLSLKAEVRSITLLKKSSQLKNNQFSKHITILTKEDIRNYQIIKEIFIKNMFYLLIKYELK